MLLAIVALGCATASIARAAFPGTNGKIAFAANNEYFCDDIDRGLAAAIYTFTPGAAPTTIDVHHPVLRHAGDPDWSPSGKRIAGARYEPVFGHSSQGYDSRGVFTAKANGSSRTPITSEGFQPAWSPNRRRFAFHDSLNRLRTIKLDGTDSRLLDSHNTDGVDWSSRNKLAYVRWRLGPHGAFKIFTSNPDGTGRHFVVRGDQPDWSPNGRRLVFQTDAEQIAVIKPDGTGLHVIRSNGFHPVWSPDATQIAFTTGYNTGDVYVMDANGTGAHQVAQLTANSCGTVGTVAGLAWQRTP